MMKKCPIFLILSLFIISCTTSKTSTTSEALLMGDWYGGPGTKYAVNNSKKKWIQDLPAGNARFVYGEDHIFINYAANTKSLYEIKGKKIYYDMDKPANARYYNIETLSADSLIVTGPYKDNKKLYVPYILYRLSYYRRK